MVFFRSYSHCSAAFDRLYNDDFSIVWKLRKLPPKKSCYPFTWKNVFFKKDFVCYLTDNHLFTQEDRIVTLPKLKPRPPNLGCNTPTFKLARLLFSRV